MKYFHNIEIFSPGVAALVAVTGAGLIVTGASSPTRQWQSVEEKGGAVAPLLSLRPGFGLVLLHLRNMKGKGSAVRAGWGDSRLMRRRERCGTSLLSVLLS